MQSLDRTNRHPFLTENSVDVEFNPSLKYFFWTHTPALVESLYYRMKSAITPEMTELTIAQEGLGISKEDLAERERLNSEFVNCRDPNELREREMSLQETTNDRAIAMLRFYNRLFSETDVQVKMRNIDIFIEDPAFEIKYNETLLREDLMTKLAKTPVRDLGVDVSELKKLSFKWYRDGMLATLHADNLRNDVMVGNIKSLSSELNSHRHLWVLCGASHDLIARAPSRLFDGERNYVVLPDEILQKLPPGYQNISTLLMETMKLRKLNAGAELDENDFEDRFLQHAMTACTVMAVNNSRFYWQQHMPAILDQSICEFFATQCVLSLEEDTKRSLVDMAFASIDITDHQSLIRQAARKVILPFMAQSYIHRRPETRNPAVRLLHQLMNP